MNQAEQFAKQYAVNPDHAWDVIWGDVWTRDERGGHNPMIEAVDNYGVRYTREANRNIRGIRLEETLPAPNEEGNHFVFVFPDGSSFSTLTEKHSDAKVTEQFVHCFDMDFHAEAVELAVTMKRELLEQSSDRAEAEARRWNAE